jgi:hypothetical protein
LRQTPQVHQTNFYKKVRSHVRGFCLNLSFFSIQIDVLTIFTKPSDYFLKFEWLSEGLHRFRWISSKFMI